MKSTKALKTLSSKSINLVSEQAQAPIGAFRTHPMKFPSGEEFYRRVEDRFRDRRAREWLEFGHRDDSIFHDYRFAW